MKIVIKSISMPDEPYYVYELAYPQGFIDEEGNDLSGIAFYVGKGTVVSAQSDSPERIDMHEHTTRAYIRKNPVSTLGRKGQVIYSIWEKNRAVHKRIVFSSFDKNEVVREEKRRIKMYGSLLTNCQGNPKELVRRIEQLAKLKEPCIQADSDLARFCDALDSVINDDYYYLDSFTGRIGIQKSIRRINLSEEEWEQMEAGN